MLQMFRARAQDAAQPPRLQDRKAAASGLSDAEEMGWPGVPLQANAAV